MVEIRRILCPIDFSDVSRHALEHAVAMAKWYESEITVLHVIHPAFTLQPPILFAELQNSAIPTDGERESLEGELRLWLEPATRAGVKTHLIVDRGNPAPRILAHSSARRADLIVMGMHGLTGIERFMLGSVAERVLCQSACPVMTVPAPIAPAAKVPYVRLLCPVDFSESSLAALRFAFSIAEESDAHLTLLHVIDWPPDDDLIVEQLDAPTMRRAVEGPARARLEALVPADERVWCKPMTKVGYGKPYRHILEIAESEGTDLIVIGVHGRNPLDRALFGSTTNHVVRRSPCPVLTLRG